MIALLYTYKIAYTADRRSSTMNSVLYYDNIICAMRRFCLIGFLLPMYNLYMFGTGGVAQIGFRTTKYNNA